MGFREITGERISLFISHMMPPDNDSNFHPKYGTICIYLTASVLRNTIGVEPERKTMIKAQAQVGHRKTTIPSSASLFLVAIHKI